MEWGAVVGVEDAPGFEVGDGSFDDVSDFSEFVVEAALVVFEVFLAWFFLDWYVAANTVVAFIGGDVVGADGIKDAGCSECCDVVGFA